MGNRQRKAKRAEGQSVLGEAADRATRAYESTAKSAGVHVTAVMVIGRDGQGNANVSVSADPDVDLEELVRSSLIAYMESIGKPVVVMSATPRR
jgi:hypothetical protein